MAKAWNSFDPLRPLVRRFHVMRLLAYVARLRGHPRSWACTGTSDATTLNCRQVARWPVSRLPPGRSE